MRERIALTLVVTGLFACAIGCKKEVDKAEFKTAINKSFTGRHECVWPQPIELPAQTDPSKDESTRVFNALTDAGLLIRGSAERQRFLVGSKQVNKYDLSDKGRPAWTPDPSQPGYGNFCFGHRTVDSIDSFTTGVNGSGSKTAQVNYHYSFADVPAWAKNQEVQTAFSSAGAALAHSQPGQDSLVMNGDAWQVAK
jgi:hypothetical protein